MTPFSSGGILEGGSTVGLRQEDELGDAHDRQHLDRSESRPAERAVEAPVHRLLALQRAIGNRALARLLQPKSPLELMKKAASDPAQPLDAEVRGPLEERLGTNLGGVRVHSGPASDAAAEAVGARAYTVGTDVHLGREGRSAHGDERRRLLTHEAVHTVQQGSRAVALRDSLRVAAPDEPAEREATAIAADVKSGALELRDNARVTQVEPALQRDLTGEHKITEGTFKLNLKTESHAGAKSGMSGTVKFYANDKAPDSTKIRLYQAVRLEDLTTGKDYVWTGVNAPRTAMQTAADPTRPGIDPGWWIDINPALTAPRAKKADPAVSPYYRDYWPNAADSRDGSKAGKTVNEASLWDYPGWSANCRFTFETVAKATDTGHVYGTVMWGFTVSDGAKGTVDHEHSVGRDVTTQTTDEALKRMEEYYNNPGTPGAPAI